MRHTFVFAMVAANSLLLGCEGANSSTDSPNEIAVPLEAQLEDLEEKARLGWVGCQLPNEAQRSCNTTHRFEFLPNGDILLVADALMPRENAVDDYRLKAKSKASLNADRFCFVLSVSDLTDARFEFVSRPTSVEEQEALRYGQIQLMSGMPEQEVCIRIISSEEGLLAQSFLAGQHSAEFDTPWKWIPPGEEWQVSR